MLGFFLILGFIIGFMVWASKNSANIMPKRCDTDPVDRKHKWIVRFNNDDHKGYLVCKVCGKLPGEE